MSETTVFVSPLAALDARLPSLGDGLIRRWDPAWTDLPAEQVLRHLAEDHPAILVIGPGVDDDVAGTWITALAQHRADIAVVLVADPHGPILLHALRSGVADVIPPTVTQKDLVAALARAREKVRQRDPLPTHAPGASTGRMIAVLSPKGGTGKTMIASSLAVALNERLGGGEVGLLDLDVQFGGVASALGLLSDHTLGDAATAARLTLDATTFKVYLTRHTGGAYVLTSPSSLVEAEEIDVEHTKVVLNHFADMFEWSIIDTAAGIGEHTLVALEFATDLLFVTTPDVASVKALRRAIEALELVGMLNGERHLVVNRYEGRGHMSTSEIGGHIGLAVSATIPPSRLVSAAMDSGRTVLEGPAKDPAIKAIRDLADLFVPLDDSGNAKQGRFRKKGR